MRAVCPNNSNHKMFITVAHVSEDWVVDDVGNFQEVANNGETVAGPCFDNLWTCNDCGAEAVIK